LTGEHPKAIRPLKLLLLQQTGCEEQELPATPRPVRGLQFMPNCPCKGPRRAPKRLVMISPSMLFACWTELQHCTGPVLHWFRVVSSRATAAAEAKRGRATTTRAEMRESILNKGVCGGVESVRLCEGKQRNLELLVNADLQRPSYSLVAGLVWAPRAVCCIMSAKL